MSSPTHRNQFPAWLKSLGLAGKAVEVGVAEGNFARMFLAEWPGEYFMVDLWRHIDGYNDAMNGDDAEHQARYQQAMSVAAQYADRCAVVIADSAAAAQKFQPRSLDFVYIDADHSYEGCKRDILAWHTRVKKGGILAGHDYMNSPPQYEVRRAVAEICGGPCGITHEAAPSWWIHIR